MKTICISIASVFFGLMFFGVMYRTYDSGSVPKFNTMCQMLLDRGDRTSSNNQQWWQEEVAMLRATYANSSCVNRWQMYTALEECLNKKSYKGCALKSVRPVDALESGSIVALRTAIIDCKIHCATYTNDMMVVKQWKKVEDCLQAIDIPLQKLIVEVEKMKHVIMAKEMMNKSMH